MSGMGHNSQGPYHDLPERRRCEAEQYAELKAQLEFLVEMRKPSFEKIKQVILDSGEKNKSEAERRARMSPEYETILSGIRAARHMTLDKYAEVVYLDMMFKQWQGLNATAREEMRQVGR